MVKNAINIEIKRKNQSTTQRSTKKDKAQMPLKTPASPG